MSLSFHQTWDPLSILQSPPPCRLPQKLLYTTSSGLGGTGLNTTSLQGALAAQQQQFLARAICYENEQSDIPRSQITSLNWHPVRALSFLESQRYYAAKKHYLARFSARVLQRHAFDCFHSWSGDCLDTLIQARRLGIPSLLDIPTWHRNKGRKKGGETRSERETRLQGGKPWFQKIQEISRLHVLAEYDLADLILVPSKASAQTFLDAGIPAERLHYLGRGVDPRRYRPGSSRPQTFRAIFVGARIGRKGVHLLLEAWHKLKLPNAELILLGTPHPEIQPAIQRWKTDNVQILGFTPNVQQLLTEASVFVFPSECEGFAKATLEAAACGLPIITTVESGDAVEPGVTGTLIRPNHLEDLMAALDHAATHEKEMAEMGRLGRQRIETCLTWDHYRQRLLHAYQRVISI